jgi:hypothetical protein
MPRPGREKGHSPEGEPQGSNVGPPPKGRPPESPTTHALREIARLDTPRISPLGSSTERSLTLSSGGGSPPSRDDLLKALEKAHAHLSAADGWVLELKRQLLEAFQ